MNNLNKIAVAVVLLCSGVSATAVAQTVDYNPSWYIAPSINMMDTDERFGVDREGWGGGVKFGKPVSQFVDIQFGGTWSRARVSPNKYQHATLGVDGLFLFSRGSIRPFVLLGAGYQKDQVNTPFGSASKNSPYISAGLGAQFSLTDQLSLQADVRRYQGHLRDNTWGFDRSKHNYLTIGLNYAFDKPAEPARPAPPPPPAPVAAPEPAPVAPPPPPARFEKTTLSATELFAFNSANLSMPQPKLDAIANALVQNPQYNNIGVNGYADRIGSDKYNQKLSEKRAQAVKNYLVSKGVAAERLIAEGRGESDPVVQCDDKKRSDLIKCLEPNRRVEIDEVTIERRVQ